MNGQAAVVDARRVCETEGHAIEVATLSPHGEDCPRPVLLLCVRGCGHLGWQLIAWDRDLPIGSCPIEGHQVVVHMDGPDPRSAACARCGMGWLVNSIVCASHLTVPTDARTLTGGPRG